MKRLVSVLFVANAIVFTHSLNAKAGVFVTAATGVSTHSYVQFYFEDEAGRRTGRLPDGTEVADIPGTRGYYGVDSVDDLIANQAGPEAVEFHTSSFPVGRFKLVLVSLATTSYWLKFDIVNDNNISIQNDFSGYALAGTTIAFNFEHQPAASAPSAVTKFVTLAALRQSVQAVRQANQLGDAKFVAKLDKILAEAEKALFKKGGKDNDRENKKEAVVKLLKFIKELEKAFKGEKDEDRDEDDDKDHEKHADKKDDKPAKRFVSEEAFKSLKSDAEILIASLGGKPGKGDKDD